jgi:hypothetical protein
MEASLTRDHYTIGGELAAAVTVTPGDRIFAADLAGGNVYVSLVQNFKFQRPSIFAI